jgi:hypothetical protein
VRRKGYPGRRTDSPKARPATLTLEGIELLPEGRGANRLNDTLLHLGDSGNKPPLSPRSKSSASAPTIKPAGTARQARSSETVIHGLSKAKGDRERANGEVVTTIAGKSNFLDGEGEPDM